MRLLRASPCDAPLPLDRPLPLLCSNHSCGLFNRPVCGPKCVHCHNTGQVISGDRRLINLSHCPYAMWSRFLFRLRFALSSACAHFKSKLLSFLFQSPRACPLLDLNCCSISFVALIELRNTICGLLLSKFIFFFYIKY